jgi:membrane-anchored mycosin MYCP
MVRTARLAVATVVAALIVLIAAPAVAAPAANVPYYQVQSSYQGHPENLFEIAARFLGDGNRADDILDLNAGRVQPDGGVLADPAKVRSGWTLVLPWDAVGAGVQYGPVPAAGTASPCVKPTTVGSAAYWGQTLLNPARVWASASGAGIRVAVVDSGIAAVSPQLAGRVAAGTDLVDGTGRGAVDCLGTGTGIAGIVAGDDGAGGRQFGLAPQATVVPIQIAGASGTLPAPAAATAIEVAVSSGVQVITLGARVDPGQPAVRAAIDQAIAHNVVVVVPARTAALPAEPGLLRVAGVADNRAPEKNYPTGAVDLAAPGVKVATIGRSGSGPQYAAAFVAGAVALVRSAHPSLSAADVTRQVLRTATPWANPDDYGAGLVNPYDAVLSAPATTAATVTATGDDGRSPVIRTVAWLVLWLVAAGVLLLLGWPAVRHLRSVLAARAERRAQLAAERDDPFWHPPADVHDPDETTSLFLHDDVRTVRDRS